MALTQESALPAAANVVAHEASTMEAGAKEEHPGLANGSVSQSNGTIGARANGSASAGIPMDRPHTPPRRMPTIIVHADEQTPSKGHDPEPASPTPRSSSFRRQKRKPVPPPSTTGVAQKQASRFLTLSTPIPTGSLADLSAERVHFSNRGSLILLDSDHTKAWPRQGTFAETIGRLSPGNKARGDVVQQAAGRSTDVTLRPPGTIATAGGDRSSKVLSADESHLSRRIRAMYEYGCDDPFIEPTLIEEEEEAQAGLLAPRAAMKNGANGSIHKQNGHLAPGVPNVQGKLPHETAGGIEDWRDVGSQDVDRYGFIVAAPAGSRDSRASNGPSEGPAAQRVSTPLLEVSNSPRKRGVLRRMPSKASTVGTANRGDGTPQRHASRRSVKPQGSIYSYRSNRSVAGSQNSLRSPLASKDRKLMIDAADMLTLPPGLSEFGANGPRTTAAVQQKEREREVKWKKMATLRPGSKNGSGMQFDFDTTNPKLIERTWKGIPDRWRATAWYSFLEASARKRRSSASEQDLFAAFRSLQAVDSSDDVQIDMDVPRTINRHIMFRRRYRGGQRLLFRVLHALSLYFPEVGYVQGMAALATTLLCYYDEEHTFVMMVRLWQLRGLERLYESGFEGLMDALGDFEKEWLRNGDVARKLDELGIHCTAYGTRWYLTLFNYSIPFPAQLRVWDVFMLLGDQSRAPAAATTTTSSSTSKSKTPSTQLPLPTTMTFDLDVLHATSAALMDATREIILDSDFENAMKILTSWIPVKDEDLLMKVAHAEWKQRKRRAGKSK